MTHYDVLGVPATATQDQIKKQYRKLSLDFHPDRPNGNAAKFKEINEAYENLFDPRKRKQYDASLHPMPDIFDIIFNKQGGFSPEMLFQQSPFSPDMFQSLMKPPLLLMTVSITLDQSFTGCTIPIPIERWVQNRQMKQLEQETVYIDIPRGIDANECILIQNKGNMGQDGALGDVRIAFTIVNNTKLERKGLDLWYTHDITLKESLCGFSFDVDYLEGKSFKINNPTGHIVSPSFKLIQANMGMVRGDHTGQLIISFNILFPKTLSEDTITQLNLLL